MPIEYLQQPRFQALQDQADATENEGEKRKFLTQLVGEIVNAINEKTVEKIEQGVDVNNLDEITASLRNELARANEPLAKVMKQLKMTTEEQTKVIKDLEEKAVEDFNSQYQTVIVKRVRDKVEVSNLHEISFPSQLNVSNFSDLVPYLQDLANKISALRLDVKVDAPQITVQPTPINIPATVFPEQFAAPEIDLTPILKALEAGLKVLRTNGKANPLAVRFADGGGNWVKDLFNKQAATTTQFLSDVSYIKSADGTRINPATNESVAPPSAINGGSQVITTAGTKVQLTSTSTASRYVIIVGKTTNTGKIYVGGSSIDNTRGRPLNAEQSEKIDINDISKIWLDADVNGEGVTYLYVA